MRVPHALFVAVLAAFALCACGRTPVVVPDAHDGGADGGVEFCNGLDDDGDHAIDEDFRDERGRYVSHEHCGACGHVCDQPIAHATETGCGLIDDSAACIATACEDGYVPSTGGSCVELRARVCLPCVDDGDCGSVPSAQCAKIGGESRCSYGCAFGCPAGYVCEAGEYCIPNGDDCHCDDGELFELACPIDGAPDGCFGRRTCDNGRLSDCLPPAEICNQQDDDCDGILDEGFRDARGAYSLDDHNCGACGIDCTDDTAGGATLACGGDPFAPTCVTRCPDLADGLNVGDHVDADGRIPNGCECQVQALSDESATGSSTTLDTNCDGADGEVIESFYVATDGDDTGPGSPTLPLRTIGVALQRAGASLVTAAPRPHIYVASGTYTESVSVPDGVFLHGGYRRDYLARNLHGFEVVVIAPVGTTLPGGAAMLIDHAGAHDTLVEGIDLRGRDARTPGAPAIGLVVANPGPALILRELSVRSGQPGPGSDGAEGRSGASSSTPATGGEPQRVAVEGDTHLCLVVPVNTTQGGLGGANTCGGADVSGGRGGSPVCPNFGAHAPDGEDGKGVGSAPGGARGVGGTDVEGPIFGGSSCPGSVCCGLADFSVPTLFPQPEPGDPGSDGGSGAAGAACVDARGAFFGATWAAALALSGTAGTAGGGGGGGGAGGGSEMVWTATSCEWPDGLGGAGGGGGAAGCGGHGGSAGQSGGPAIAMLIVSSDVDALPFIENVEFTSADGGRGGDGGAGGDGGQGGNGGYGGALADAVRTTPTLAGALPGQRGGKGGEGGAGGGGGGGCGGSSVGLWITGLGSMSAVADFYRDGNTFAFGNGGAAGRGGGGPVPADDGIKGSETDVLVR